MKVYAVVFEKPEKARNWSAYVPDLPGCVATGATQQECAQQIAEAIEFHIEGLILSGETVPSPSSVVSTVSVAA